MKSYEAARSMRKNPTEAETALWEIVRGKKINEKKFHRQFPIKFKYKSENRFFFADFYCPEKSLVIEIDGGVNQLQEDYEELRTHVINELGMKIIRFSSDDALTNLDRVIEILIDETRT